MLPFQSNYMLFSFFQSSIYTPQVGTEKDQAVSDTALCRALLAELSTEVWTRV